MIHFTQEVHSNILDFLTTSEMACLALSCRHLYESTLSNTVYFNRVAGIVKKLERQVMYFYKKYNGVGVRGSSRLVEMAPLRCYDNVRRRYLILREYLNRFSKSSEPMTCVFGKGGGAPLLFPPLGDEHGSWMTGAGGEQRNT